MSLFIMIALPYFFHVSLVCVRNAFKMCPLFRLSPDGRMCLSLFRGPGRRSGEPYFSVAPCSAHSLHFGSNQLGSEDFLALAAPGSLGDLYFLLPSLSVSHQGVKVMGWRQIIMLPQESVLPSEDHWNAISFCILSSPVLKNSTKKDFLPQQDLPALDESSQHEF